MTIPTRVLFGLSIATAVAAAVTVAFAITVYLGISKDTSLLEQSGRIRGTVQRLAKNELSGSPPARLIADVDSGLGKLELAVSEGREYQASRDSLRALDAKWQDFKVMLRSSQGLPQDEYRVELMAMSESLWYLADSVVAQIRASSELILYQARYLLVSLGALLALAVSVALLARSHVAGKLEAASYTDHLTGLYNRRFFAAALLQESRRAERSGAAFSLIFFDLDEFKQVNDRAGHPAGDRCLVAVAAAVAARMRRSDLLFRLGGDEFAALLPGTGGTEGVAAAEMVRLAVVELPPAAGGAGVTISLGVSAWRHGQDAETLQKEADEALYLAKQSGRNRTVLFGSTSA